MSWSREFDDPISLPAGRKLLTLKDAADYVTKLPKAEHSAPEWQAAMEALILDAETGGPTVKVFATTDAAETWLEENDPEGVAFEHDVLE